MKRAETDGRQTGGGRRGSRAGRVARRSLGLVGLFTGMLLVVGVGLGVSSPEPQERVHSASEQAQLDAEDRYRSAADQARALAADPGLAPELAAGLAAAAVDLDEQAEAVALPRSPGPTAAPATATATGSSAAPVPAEAPDMVATLRDSAMRSLRDAVRADPGPGRVLASAGVNQWRHALLLGHTLGMDPGLPPAGSLSAVDLAAGNAAPAPAECAGTPLGPDADRRALLDARTAEDQARYAYEVAAALLPDPAQALAAASTHAEAAEAATDRLTALCVAPDPAPAGYAIGPDFRADPLAATRAIEAEHTELYAGLIATVGPDARAWAVASFSAAAQRSLDAGAPLDALPGLVGSASTPDATPAPADPAEQPDG